MSSAGAHSGERQKNSYSGTTTDWEMCLAYATMTDEDARD